MEKEILFRKGYKTPWGLGKLVLFQAEGNSTEYTALRTRALTINPNRAVKGIYSCFHLFSTVFSFVAAPSPQESRNMKCSLDTLSSSSISSCAGCSGNMTPVSDRAGGSSKMPPSLLLISLSSEIVNVTVKIWKKVLKPQYLIPGGKY